MHGEERKKKYFDSTWFAMNIIISIWNCFIEEKIERFVFQNKYTHVCFFPSFVSSVKGSNPLEMSLSVGPSWFKVKHSTLRENSKKSAVWGEFTLFDLKTFCPHDEIINQKMWSKSLDIFGYFSSDGYWTMTWMVVGIKWGYSTNYHPSTPLLLFC